MMNALGEKIARKRKDAGLTQVEFAEKLSVTRQTVSRWEGGAVMPDIEKIGDIATILGVSCDYLLKDDMEEEQTPSVRATAPQAVSRLMQDLKGRKVKLQFFEDEGDADLLFATCTIVDFEGNWMKVSASTKKGQIEKLLPVSSILSFEIKEEG